jgi:uncharacterized protein
LQDSLTNMLKGNQEFIMIDEQKVFYEEAFYLALECVKNNKKQVMVIERRTGYWEISYGCESFSQFD